MDGFDIDEPPDVDCEPAMAEAPLQLWLGWLWHYSAAVARLAVQGAQMCASGLLV